MPLLGPSLPGAAPPPPAHRGQRYEVKRGPPTLVVKTMKIGLHTRLKPGAEERYEEYHRAIWPEVLEGIRRVGITSYVIFRDGLDLFHYIECDDYDRAIAELAASPLNQRWEAEMAPMTTVAHDFSGKGSDRMSLIFDF